MSDPRHPLNSGENNNNNNNNNNNSNTNNSNNTHTISNLSAGLKSVSLADQQQNEVNLNLLQQQLHREATTQQQQSRITQFFQNQPAEGYTLFSHRSAPNGFKVAIILSELNLPFNTIFLISTTENKGHLSLLL